MNEPKKRSNPNFFKKGKASWKPASLNEFFNKEPGYHYRMASKDPTIQAQRAQEGWENVSKISSPQTSHDEPGRINDGNKLTSVVEGHDWILQRLPDELAESRIDYFNDLTERRTKGLTSHLKKEIKDKGGNAPVHGNISISTLQGEQIIE